MSRFEKLVWIGVAYCLIDFATGMWLGRCVMPGLRCKACTTYPKTRRLHDYLET